MANKLDKKKVIPVTKAEQAWMKRLEKLLDKAPKKLMLFGNSGSLQVWKHVDHIGYNVSVLNSFSMACDGGDPVDGEDYVADPVLDFK